MVENTHQIYYQLYVNEYRYWWKKFMSISCQTYTHSDDWTPIYNIR